MSEFAAVAVIVGFVLQSATNVGVIMYLRHLRSDVSEDRARIMGLERSVYGLPGSASRVADR